MRPTWLVLGAVVAAGVFTYTKLLDRAEEGAPSAPEAGRQGPSTGTPSVGTPALQRATGTDGPAANGGGGAGAAPEDPGVQALEVRAQALLQELGQASQARDRGRYDEALARLEAEAWDAPSARRFAVQLGHAALEQAGSLPGPDRVLRLDRGRRLLSRGVDLPEMFDAANRPTAERDALVGLIQRTNQMVMTWGRVERTGLQGITRPYEVPPGYAPVKIVSQEHLPYGPNALLYWNKEGRLRPLLRAGETILLPEGEVWMLVDQARRRLEIWLDDVFVKDFLVGIGREETPTPVGTFTIGRDRSENPDWWFDGKMIPYGDPANELGSVWLPLENDVYLGAGYGIHGTNKPDTVGTRCSNGCVRLVNAEATEVYWWTRTSRNDGRATRVLIR